MLRYGTILYRKENGKYVEDKIANQAKSISNKSYLKTLRDICFPFNTLDTIDKIVLLKDKKSPYCRIKQAVFLIDSAISKDDRERYMTIQRIVSFKI